MARVAQLDYQLNIQGREKYIIAMCSAAISEMIYNICRYNCFLKTPGEQIYRFSEGTGVLHNPMQICRKKGFRWRSRAPARHVTFQLCQVLSQAAFAQSSPSTRCSALCTLPRPASDVSLLNLSPLHFKPINAEISPADSQARG